ncbi:DMT family transporter [Pikeienuella piscinae]|uniref:DMT family transporter n=1 Tax=Pikeienuella piscinae TaxID=2748098 RepID=A0A7L5BWP2_9RHOB|nr:DMT family transporter [Pikeienuella piscinae]QIE54009.1 DMT family transporter [Pikeienuella piscinae]
MPLLRAAGNEPGVIAVTDAPSRPIAALAFMMAATLSFMLMAVAGRELAARLDTFEIMTYRSAIGFAIVLAVARWRGILHDVKARRMGLHALRNATHFFGQNLWLYAVALIPFSQLFAFEFSVPLWVALAAPFFLNERLTRTRMAAALIGFVGIILVARPDMSGLSAGVIAAALCAFGFTATSITTKLLTRTEATVSIMFWLTLMQLCFGLITAGYDLDFTLPALEDMHWVAAVGICGLSAHFCITSALALAPATVVAPLDFARLPIAAVVGMIFYDEALAPLVLVGAAVIFAANFVNIRAETRATPP